MTGKEEERKMNGEDLFRSLNDIEDQHIEAAAPQGGKKRRAAGWISAAACLVLAAVLGIAGWEAGIFGKQPVSEGETAQPDQVVTGKTEEEANLPEETAEPDAGSSGSQEERRWPQKTVDASETTGSEIALLKPWEERTNPERFSEAVYRGSTYTTRNTALDAALAGEWLEDIVMETMRDDTDETVSMAASLYGVEGISADCAVAVRFEGEEEYYVYVNPGYQPKTWGAMMEDLDFKEQLSFGSAWYSFTAESGEFVTVEFIDPEDAAVWSMLLGDPSLPNCYNEFQEYAAEISVGVDIPLLGYENISLSVTKDGYLLTNILDTGKAFYIGEEKAEAFVAYVLENCTGYELVYTGNESAQPE